MRQPRGVAGVLSLLSAAALFACGEGRVPAPAASPRAALRRPEPVRTRAARMTPVVTAPPPKATTTAPRAVEADEHWYFEALSSDGRRALLRQLDPQSRATFHIRVVDVDSGRTLEETVLPELAKIPASTIGGKPTELAELEWMLASPAFGRDIIKGSHLAGSFPFGACGRLAAAHGGSAISFDAGDWLYMADDTGRVRRRLVEEAAYDPRFTPDGKHLFFRRSTGTADVLAKYELYVVPSDLSAPPRAIAGSAGMRDRFVAHPDGQTAFAVASQSRGPAPLPRARGDEARRAADTCVVSLGLRPPFATKRLACLDGAEQLVESVISPKGKWAALSTKKKTETAGERRVEWRLRVVSLTSGKVVRDEPEPPGLAVRAISDAGVLVQSGAGGIVVTDVPQKTSRAIDRPIDLGYRGFFRNDADLVYVRGGAVSVLDVSKDASE
ncbi:MAG: hypothetical protein KF764_15565 [Labilithrix sp.]|nr:hypothetical protein [Labilithrix sp.]